MALDAAQRKVDKRTAVRYRSSQADRARGFGVKSLKSHSFINECPSNFSTAGAALFSKGAPTMQEISQVHGSLGKTIRTSTLLLLSSILLAGCYRVPASIKLYAADLPHRADGQYALIDDDSVKKSLVVKDAMLKCKIDEEESSGEGSAACQCAKSASPDWTVDCKPWLGEHTPKAAPATPESPAAPAPTTPTPAPSAPTTPAPLPS